MKKLRKKYLVKKLSIFVIDKTPLKKIDLLKLGNLIAIL